ncbi:ABC transporter permease [Oryzihumus leptocrescens]|uniref:ABC-2 type transport system permease protein n=1 Tax=Oryzihumus leptocrescens TaxID=297536 RepID=A0A542ZK04_9MICO|nr:ABC transporter permease [Oryzihumus leptocrescens]TQL60629.1 ABC-2 type transport system permease protein [Oryzihumus leptocrescens]
MSAPATPRTRVLAQARFEAGTLLRNGEQLLVAVVLPALALVGLALAHSPSLGPGRRIDVAVPGVLALAVISTAFTGQAIQTGFDRRYGVLRLLGVTPLGRGGLLVAKSVAVLAVELLQFVVIGGLGLALGWHPSWVGLLPALLVALLGTWAFVALALLLAGTVRAEGVLAIANLVWVVLLALGGVIIPRSEQPAGLSHLAAALPSSALADGLRDAFLHGRLAGIPVLVLVLWGAVATVVAAWTFRWGD